MAPTKILLPKEEIIPLYDSSVPTIQIGKLYGVSWATIVRRLHEWGIRVKKRNYPGICPFTPEEISRGQEKVKRFLGHRHHPESRAKMSVSQKGRNTWSRGRNLAVAHKAKIGVASRKLWSSPRYRSQVSQSLKLRWSDPAFAMRMQEVMAKGRLRKPTRPEQRIKDIVAKYNLPFRYTGDGSFLISGYSPDFVNCNGSKVVIEVFGDYWHGKMARTWKETELGRIMAFNSFGFQCIVLWEKEINTLPEEIIVKRIKNESRRVSLLHK